MSWLLVKQAHVALAVMTAAGFALRGYWMIRDSRAFNRRLTRILPHVVDTLLLASGLALAVGLAISPISRPWFAAKLAAVAVYIVTGTIALRRGSSRGVRIAALAWALAVLAYIFAVALTKSPVPWC